MSKAEFQISMSGGATASDPDLVYYGNYHTPPPELWGLGGRDQPCYSNPKVDRLLEDARKTTDFALRHRMYREMIQNLQDDVANIPIAFVPNGFALQALVQDFELTVLDELLTYGNGGLVKTWISR